MDSYGVLILYEADVVLISSSPIESRCDSWTSANIGKLLE